MTERASKRAASRPTDGGRRVSSPARSTARAGRYWRALDGYLEDSASPLASLVFILPLIVIYELGTAWFVSDPLRGVERRNTAFALLQQAFTFVHVGGRFLPPLCVITILLAWHLARRDKWKAHLNTAGWMVVESVLLAVPLVLVGLLSAALAGQQPAVLMSGEPSTRAARIVLSIGAGIYEELVFRLVGMTLLSLLLLDALRLSRAWSATGMIAITSFLFAGYHHINGEPLVVPNFIFRALAGVYFGILFLLRGFGVTAGVHAAYDVFVVGIPSDRTI